MTDIHLTMGIYDYDHVRDLFTGRVKPEGVELTCLVMPVWETFYRFFRDQEWDVSELSFAGAVQAIDRGEAPFVLIPVFPSRLFRHSGIYIRADGPIKRPEDLSGARIGIAQWAQTATAYIRGWMTDSLGIQLTDVDWYQLGPDSPGRLDNSVEQPPEGVRLTNLPNGSLAEMVVDGKLDAFLSAAPPQLFLDGDPRIKRLFPDYEGVERDYFKATGIYPIMHTVAIRRSSYEANPWIAGNLLAAFEAAKNRSVERMHDMDVSQIALPWIQAAIERDTKLFFPDGDYWPYGIERNRTTIEAFLKFCHDQRITKRRLAPEDIFVKEAREPFRMLQV
ncbi:MAG: 4,5-dihydroxyphthalate decarboxylase [Alphaproteobacteria bacterium]